ncbi:MAG: D-2-hydroxyacid dehydrogenase [Gammaproteobacteria bacterium]|nr:D-2-hydroxyacid dehydrogenase [Gammaproteobacteria bacterium]
MKLMVHFDRPEVFLDVITARLPRLRIECCRDNAGLAAALARFRPELFFVIKFDRTEPYPRDTVLACPTIRWITIGGTGVDHLRPWDPGRITVTNSVGVGARAIGQYALGAMLAITYRFPRFIRSPERLDWSTERVGIIDGQTVVVVGLGHSGKEVARLAGGLGMKVVGVKAHPGPVPGVERVYGPDRLHEALSRGDFVVVATPLTDRTHHMIDRDAFAAMKPGVGIVDVSRGGVIDSAALAEALGSGHVGGAVLDVHEEEPLPLDSPIRGFENAIVTPHCSGAFVGWERASAAMFCDNVERHLRGEPLERVVDPTTGY